MATTKKIGTNTRLTDKGVSPEVWGLLIAVAQGQATVGETVSQVFRNGGACDKVVTAQVTNADGTPLVKPIKGLDINTGLAVVTTGFVYQVA